MNKSLYKELIKFDTAKLAFEKGFIDVHLLTWLFYEKDGRFFNQEYEIGNPDYICSTQSELQTWLRDEHKIIVVPVYSYNDNPHYSVHIEIIEEMERDENSVLISGIDFEPMLFETYEEALERGLVEALKLL
jgi:hypothetical protein